jgi:adenylate cyclase class IV
MTSALEVECKFLCNKELEGEISRRALSSQDKKITDNYFDTEAMTLLRIDNWLRRRNDLFELKIPSVSLVDRIRLLEERKERHVDNSKPYVDSYIEVTDPSVIAKHLLSILPSSDLLSTKHVVTTNHDLEILVSTLGLSSFAEIKTMRRTYKLSLLKAPDEIIGIDIDAVLFDDGSTYSVAEVEVMVSNGIEDEKARTLIDLFFEEFNVKKSDKPIVGKVLEYFKRCAPAHFAVVKNGLMKLKLAGT